MPSDTAAASSFLNHISQTNLPISFSSLPTPNNQPSPKPPTPIEFIRLNVPNVIHALQTMSLHSNILALITSSVHISYDHHIPTYYYFTSYLPNTHLHFPGLPPIKASHLPQPFLDRDDEAYHYFLNFGACYLNSKGIIINTLDSLEPRAIKAITDAACVPTSSTGATVPPLHCIGPLVADAKDRAFTSPDHASLLDCLSWLNEQPSRSVVFLCFGRKGAFSAAQLKELAIGLERSDQRFLWVVRNPPPHIDTEPNLELLLPQGFLERTKTRGLVMKSWAPQADVLRHESVGGFVTHCGWNSVMEAVSLGVPMVAWPLYAEQHMNSVVLVEEMKLALPIVDTSSLSSKEEDKEGLVKAEVVERRVRELMNLEEGKAVREKSMEMKAMAEAAWNNGGSSLTTFSKLVASWKQG
ncbi:hypothetical protein L1049_020402 [Liquidambar formosana]|uniref:Glycosyltransferase n=1 Tax=Liquidambar formosana TaxID=63359 RepID=A0AAP0X7B8_LIQFO